MFELKVFFIMCLICASVACIMILLLIALERAILRLLNKFKRTSTGYKYQLFVISGLLIAAIWSFRYAVGLCEIWISSASNTLTAAEEFLNSFVYSLHIFGADDGLGSYVNTVKNMMGMLFGNDSVWVSFFAGYAAVLSAAAPVAGGAVIFEIIASIFPNLAVRVVNKKFWREKYYFSELNNNTLALIKSINKENKRKIFRPAIIITDSYIDDESESSVELINEAKLLGAICVKNDIVHVPKNYFGCRKFFLIDADEKVNVQKLIELTERLGPHYAPKSEFYPFVRSDMYSSVAAQVKKNLDSKGKKVPPFVIPINGYRNIILNMLSDIPLFEPIAHQYALNRKNGQDTDLNITIFGTGQIGTEMFLGSYWCGQMLGCKLNVTVISRESEEDFVSRLNYINPELLKSSMKGDPILKIYRDDRAAPVGADVYGNPYFTFNYIPKDVKTENFENALENNEAIQNTNYFFVALGSDEENILMANKLRAILGNSHLKSKDLLRTVIAYVVFDSSLCEALNAECFYSYTKDDKGDKRKDIFMKALGSIEELYSVRNVFLTEFKSDAQDLHEKYYSSASVATRREFAKSIFKDTYSYASSIARRVHRRYKIFSAGMWEKSIFDYCEKYEAERDKIKKKLNQEAEKKRAIKEKRQDLINKFIHFYDKDKSDKTSKTDEPSADTNQPCNNRNGIKDRFLLLKGILETFYPEKKIIGEENNKADVFETEVNLSVEEGYEKLAKRYWKDYVSALKKPLVIETPKGEQNKPVENNEAARKSINGEEYRILNELAWLEHRRWNAYMRSCGFRGPHIIIKDDRERTSIIDSEKADMCTQSSAKHSADKEKVEILDPEKTQNYIIDFLKSNGNSKNLELKRHLCIVETSRKDSIKAKVKENGDFCDYELWKDITDDQIYEQKLDMLDELLVYYVRIFGMDEEKVTKMVDLTDSCQFDYKQYDYPSDEFVKYVSVDTFVQKTGLSEKKVIRLCNHGKIGGVTKSEENEDVNIPKSAILLFETKKHRKQREKYEAEKERKKALAYKKLQEEKKASA